MLYLPTFAYDYWWVISQLVLEGNTLALLTTIQGTVSQKFYARQA
jgi:hypothetical protein